MTELLKNTAQTLLRALGDREPGRLPTNGARPAAVLMPLIDENGRVEVLFTKRSPDLATHAGQISFPGGMQEPGDASLSDTALRETFEEIGVPPRLVEVITRLDQVITITNFLVTPYIGLISPQAEFSLNPVEVQRLIKVPLAKVLDPASYQTTDISWEGAKLRQMALEHNGDVIWGATARILLDLLNALGQNGGSPYANAQSIK